MAVIETPFDAHHRNYDLGSATLSPKPVFWAGNAASGLFILASASYKATVYPASLLLAELALLKGPS
jgi:hypothetical protein